MRTAHLTPAPGRVVRDPVSRRSLPPEGAPFVMDGHWLRRVADGDVIESEVTATAPIPSVVADADPAAVPLPGSTSGSASDVTGAEMPVPKTARRKRAKSAQTI